MSTQIRDGSVVRARIVRPVPPLPASGAAEPMPITTILAPGTGTERNGRIWHLGKTTLDDGFLYGHLGFERSGTAELWNEPAKDFEAARMPVGVASPFVIRLADLELAFQLREPDIQLTSFTGAMEKIIQEAAGEDWHIEAAEAAERSFDRWRASVDAIYRMRFNIVRPNPNWKGRPDLERLIEGARLAAASISIESNTGIDTDSDLVRQLLLHVDRGNGNYVASAGRPAVDGHEVATLFSSELHGEAEVSLLPTDPHTGEVSREMLRRLLT